MVKFGTLDYYKQVADFLNKDEVFGKSGLTTTLMLVFSDVLNADGTPKAFLLTIDKGKVTASEVKSDEKTEFSTTANYDTQASIAKGEINAVKAKGTKLKYNMMKAIKNRTTMERISTAYKELKDVEY